MTTGTTSLVAAMDDARGLTISVYRDYDGIRITAGKAEITLTQAQAASLRSLIGEAHLEAVLWELTNG